eukprot:TRINITY_DN557_c0_g1_i1.p1 TRINITY_DN557_c0_g1~~TRINITY_DN557_c0_g1_i1.p1  ORF type:complete len:118 (-),score=17.32 TRINITY_DN557_c0_g1_i1:36-389(-)
MEFLSQTFGSVQAAQSAENKTKGNFVIYANASDTRVPEREPIDWECPCLADVRTGPCAPAFRAAFECAHYAVDDNARLACRPLMESMADCVRSNRDRYGSYASMLDEMDVPRRAVNQ